ncbi:MAG: hypothetical protein GKR94_07240 [Gammaproteobacteria bacterium]|nr:hypothetical protein [Gammaproteobacteria bacterium]
MSHAEIVERSHATVTLQVTISLDPKSMLRSEEAIRDALNNAGCLAAEQVLKQFDTDGSAIILGDIKLTSKGLYHKTYQTQSGEPKVDRHVYQSRAPLKIVIVS